jgi:hypothetical protein
MLRIFCIGHAAPPGRETNEIREINNDNTNGVAAELTNILSKSWSNLFLEDSPSSILRAEDRMFVKAACISALENKEQTAAFQNKVKAEINSRNAGPNCC